MRTVNFHRTFQYEEKKHKKYSVLLYSVPLRVRVRFRVVKITLFIKLSGSLSLTFAANLLLSLASKSLLNGMFSIILIINSKFGNCRKFKPASAKKQAFFSQIALYST